MVRYRDGVALSQEQGEHPVSLMSAHGNQQLFSANNVEGLATYGRLPLYDPDSETVTTLRNGLDEAEDIVSYPDGRIFYTDKQLVHIKKWQANGRDKVDLNGLQEPGYLLTELGQNCIFELRREKRALRWTT